MQLYLTSNFFLCLLDGPLASSPSLVHSMLRTASPSALVVSVPLPHPRTKRQIRTFKLTLPIHPRLLNQLTTLGVHATVNPALKGSSAIL